MAKAGKKGGKRLTKKELTGLLGEFFQHHPQESFNLKQIFKVLKLNTHPLKMLAIDIIDDMVYDDILSRAGDNKYQFNSKGVLMEGTFTRKTNGKNTFTPDGSDKGIFVAERNSMGAMTGDRVEVTLMARRRNHIKEAMVTHIISHARDKFVGRLKVGREVTFLQVEGNLLAQDILIPKRKLKGGKDGDKAVVKVLEWPTEESKHMVGEVVDVLGAAGENDTEMHAILAEYGLPYSYPKAVEDAADKLDATIRPEDLAEREDFRDVTTFTIDPYDAKDFDDALSIRPAGKGLWEVGVHIADVSHYVTEGSVIDKEAQRRATSIYLVDRTIPMLPERLCNFICSLRPDEEKLTYSVVFVMNEQADVLKWHLAHTVIRSNRRFCYEEVQDILEQPAANDTPDDANYEKELRLLSSMAQQMRERRFKNGAVKFDREELHFDVDEKGKPTGVTFKVSNESHQLVEEFMLLANKTVAESVGKTKRKDIKPKTLPYRVHDVPDPTKLETLREFIVKFGYKLKTTGTKGETSRSLNKLMDDCNGRKEQKLIETVALRAMMKAKYSTHNIGHFGLAFDYYTHFTSPIRRYPDTMVHRLLTRYQAGGRSANQQKYEDLCQHSSDMEVLAAQAERASIKYKEVEYLQDKLGEDFDAHISGITEYGIYCEIDDNHCEGLVAMRDLHDDYYDFDERNYCLRGRRSHRTYSLGDPIRIRVAHANLERKQIDFVIVE